MLSPNLNIALYQYSYIPHRCSVLIRGSELVTKTQRVLRKRTCTPHWHLPLTRVRHDTLPDECQTRAANMGRSGTTQDIRIHAWSSTCEETRKGLFCFSLNVSDQPRTDQTVHSTIHSGHGEFRLHLLGLISTTTVMPAAESVVSQKWLHDNSSFTANALKITFPDYGHAPTTSWLLRALSLW